MAERPFDRQIQLGKGFVVFGDFKQRIVAKTSAARAFCPNPSRAGISTGQSHVSVGIRQADLTMIPRRPFLRWNARQLGQQSVVVRLVIAVATGISGRIDARCSLQRIDG